MLNIYALHPANERIFRLTNSRFGANYPFLDGDHQVLYFSEFDTNGYHLCSMDFRELLWETVDFSARREDPVLQKVIAQGEAASEVATEANPDYLDPGKYPSKRYSKLLNAFHIHSWAPIYYDVDRVMSLSPDSWFEAAAPGATVYSQNELGDVVTMLGYSWFGESAAHAKVTATVADFDVELYGDLNMMKGSISADEYDLYDDAGILIDYPFNLFGGGWYSMLIPSMGFEFNRLHNAPEWQKDLSASLRYYRMLPVAKAAIYPRWGISVSGSITASSYKTDNGICATLNGYAYCPGLTRGQGLKLSLATQNRLLVPSTNGFDYTLQTLPRGYQGYMTGKHGVKLSADYAIPVWLGDFTIPGVIYCRRLQLIPFGDYALETPPASAAGGLQTYWSTGGSALLDFSVFRFNFGISAGTRFSFTAPQSGTGRTRWEILLGVSL